MIKFACLARNSFDHSVMYKIGHLVLTLRMDVLVSIDTKHAPWNSERPSKDVVLKKPCLVCDIAVVSLREIITVVL